MSRGCLQCQRIKAHRHKKAAPVNSPSWDTFSYRTCWSTRASPANSQVTQYAHLYAPLHWLVTGHTNPLSYVRRGNEDLPGHSDKHTLQPRIHVHRPWLPLRRGVLKLIKLLGYKHIRETVYLSQASDSVERVHHQIKLYFEPGTKRLVAKNYLSPFNPSKRL